MIGAVPTIRDGMACAATHPIGGGATPAAVSPATGEPAGMSRPPRPAAAEPILCGHCGRTASNGISCQGICVADSGY
jgi:hypothetical protein